MSYLYRLTNSENWRQKNSLNLIASENYPSPEVLHLSGTVWMTKYGEGYPGKRYYAGNQLTDELEIFAQQKALEVFKAQKEYGANVQVLSGSPANGIVFLSVLNYGDTVMSLNIDNGGHISHMHETSSWLKFFKLVNYDLKKIENNDVTLDLEDFEYKIKEFKPKLVIIGFSAYTKKYDFAHICKLAHQYGCLVLADIAHINGLVAVEKHSSPFGSGELGADFVSMTTHKTLRGPRGAILFAKNYLPDWLPSKFLDQLKAKKNTSLIDLINRTVFPGTSGGPHFQLIASISRACQEILGEEKYPDGISFENYIQAVLDNTKALEIGLAKGGLEIVAPTENHLCLVKLANELDSLEVQKQLESIGIVLNRNKIPFDQKTPWRPSGLRLGMTALTSRGIDNQTSQNLGWLIGQFVIGKLEKNQVLKEVSKIVDSLKWYYLDI